MNSHLRAGVPKEDYDRLKPVLERMLADPAMEYVRKAFRLQKRNPKPADYESPSWAYKQAHQNGFNEALDVVLKIIETKE